jgi:hypothetical protein
MKLTAKIKFKRYKRYVDRYAMKEGKIKSTNKIDASNMQQNPAH